MINNNKIISIANGGFPPLEYVKKEKESEIRNTKKKFKERLYAPLIELLKDKKKDFIIQNNDNKDELQIVS